MARTDKESAAEKNSSMYFSDVEEEAFRRYCESDNKDEKDRIYNEHLRAPFEKMSESIIRRYDLFTPGEDFDDTMNDVMSHLITKINKFDPSKNTKAYSYCGTICKNYLLHKRQKAMDDQQKKVSYESLYSGGLSDSRSEGPAEFETTTFPQEMLRRAVATVKEMVRKPEINGLNSNDVKVGEAIITMLENWNDIFLEMESKKYMKSQVLMFLRDTTNLSAKQIRESKKKFVEAYMGTKYVALKKMA